jgi:hypothetical protein
MLLTPWLTSAVFLQHQTKNSLLLTITILSWFASLLHSARQGCSLLFYGVGSKRQFLEKFAAEALVDGGAIAFYGQQANVTAKHVMSVLVEQMSHKPARGCSHAELMGMIQAEPSSRHVYVLIHNIDGPGRHRCRQRCS